jgi:heme/copper-type cytochrome/quinol oxidase subunit 2
MQYSDLLFVWAISISWSAVFLIAVSIFLYVRRKHRSPDKASSSHVRLNDFVFLVVLASLLGLYIVSIDRTSSLIFAAGNIIVEVILILYTVKNKTGTT